jgi:hypothetical protein
MKKIFAPLLFLTGCNFLNPEIPEDLCGNGAIDEGEQCDDGNNSNSDACHNDCTEAGCGDGFVDEGFICFDPASPVNLGAVDLTTDFFGITLPGTMRFADLNNDDTLDYVVSAPGTGVIVAGLNNGNGLFQNAQRTTIPDGPVAISLAKIDNDDTADLIVSRPIINLAGDVLFLPGLGNGLFDRDNIIGVKSGDLPVVVIAADMDGNGTIEVPVFSTTTGLNENDALNIFSFSNGAFTAPTPQLLNANLNSTDVALADIDDNGLLDLITANSANNTVSIIKQGVFAAPIVLSQSQVGNALTFGVTVGDFDENGALDTAAVSFETGEVTSNLQNSDGSFSETIIVREGTESRGTQRISTADLDRDGHLDLVVTINNASVDFAQDLLILRGFGDGSFDLDLIPGETLLSAGVGSFDIFIGDLNGDSFEDIAVLNLNSNDISIILANP